MQYLKEVKIRDRKYLDSLQGSRCVICQSTSSTVGHHIRMGLGGGTGIKPSDDRCIPLCHRHHNLELHQNGEKRFFKMYEHIFGLDPVSYAKQLYNEYLQSK